MHYPYILIYHGHPHLSSPVTNPTGFLELEKVGFLFGEFEFNYQTVFAIIDRLNPLFMSYKLYVYPEFFRTVFFPLKLFPEALSGTEEKLSISTAIKNYSHALYDI